MVTRHLIAACSSITRETSEYNILGFISTCLKMRKSSQQIHCLDSRCLKSALCRCSGFVDGASLPMLPTASSGFTRGQEYVDPATRYAWLTTHKYSPEHLTFPRCNYVKSRTDWVEPEQPIF